MNTKLRARIVEFIGDLDDTRLTEDQNAEAAALYGLLTRPQGRPKGWRKKKVDIV